MNHTNQLIMNYNKMPTQGIKSIHESKADYDTKLRLFVNAVAITMAAPLQEANQRALADNISPETIQNIIDRLELSGTLDIRETLDIFNGDTLPIILNNLVKGILQVQIVPNNVSRRQ